MFINNNKFHASSADAGSGFFSGTSFKVCLLALLSLLMSSAASAQTLAREQILRAGNGSEPATLDPHKAEGVSDANIQRDLYEGLTSVSPQGAVIPGAAERWEISPDGLEYIFHLRESARWSNGDPVTAEDFVFALRRSADPATGSNYSQILTPILNADAVTAGKLKPQSLGVEAVDALTLLIRLKSPTPYFLGLLSHSTTYPIHRASFAKHGAGFARAGKLISNGAYQLSEWVVQSQVTLTRNPYYWNNAATTINKVIYYPTEDINSELKRYRAGELDYTYEIPLVQAKWVRQRFGKELRIATYAGTYYYGFNLTRPPFKDNPKLREALSLAVDRDVIVDKVMNGLALPAYGWVPPGISNYTPQKPEWASWSREKRIAEARRLYAEAGYSAESPAELEIRYNTHDDHKRIAVVIAAMWKQYLGVRATLINEEFKVYLNNRNLKRVTQAFRAAWIADYDDASAFTDILHSSHGQNDSGYNDAGYDALLAQAAAEPNLVRRRELLEQAEQRVLADWPIMPIYYYVSKHLVKPHVAGWQDNILDYHYSKDLRILAH